MAKWVRVILVVSLREEGGVVKCKTFTDKGFGITTEASLTSHTLHRQEGSGHTVADKLSLKNAIIKQHGLVIRCWHLLNTLWCNCYPWQRMQSTKSTDLIGHSKFLPWRQLDGCSVTRLFLSLWRVWLTRLNRYEDHNTCWQYTLSDDSPLSPPCVATIQNMMSVSKAWCQMLPLATLNWALGSVAHQEVKHAQAEHVKRETDVSMVVEPV